MSVFRRVALTGVVWLTALTNLIAGVPHFECRCPNGQLKRFCLGLASDGSGCCCGRTCCSSAYGGACCCGRAHRALSAGPARMDPCCEQCAGHGAGSEPTAQGSRLIGVPCCIKSLAQPEVVATAVAKGAASQDLITKAFFSVQPLLVDVLPGPVQSHAPLRPCPVRTSTDLVTVLQRLVI